jgi:hypothetical protein
MTEIAAAATGAIRIEGRSRLRTVPRRLVMPVIADAQAAAEKVEAGR